MSRAEADTTDGWAALSDGGLIPLSDIEPEPVEWAWDGWIAMATLTLLDGDPGMGKSTLAIDLACRMSRGQAMPFDERGRVFDPCGVIILTAEDDLARTVRKRVDAAGGDISKIFIRDWVKRRAGEKEPPTIEDIDVLRRDIERKDVGLVIIDPLMAFLGLETNSYNDQQVRRALAPLARLAAETGVAILMIRHLRKGGAGNAIYAGGGSIGFAGAARSVLCCTKDPADEGRRILASAKSNLSATPKSLVFRPVAEGDTSKLEWIGESEETADSLASGRGERSADALAEAKAFLADLLSKGPVAATEVWAQAEGVGISRKTLHRAKAALGVGSRKMADGSWCWVMAAGKVEGGQDGHVI